MGSGNHAAAPARELGIAPASAHRCKRARHRQSNCRVCLEVCPEGAITLDPVPRVSERCTRCGLCQTACPTEVFQGRVHSDQALLSRVEPMLRAGRRASGDVLSIHCHRAEPQHRNSVAVPCLGSVTENFLLGAIAIGGNPIRLVHGDCASCRLRAGEDLLVKAMEACLALAPRVGADDVALTRVERQRSAPASAGRRMFLRRATGGGSYGGWHWPAPGIESGDRPEEGTEAGPGSTPGRAFLRSLLGNATLRPRPALPYDERLPWASPRINERECTACGTCVNLCPTGAISRRIEEGRLAHHFSGALCVNCRLCQEACPQQVISFEPEFDARDLVRQGRAITGIRLRACEICGDVLPEREGRFCITCQRRGRVENHIPGSVAGP